MGIFGDTSDFAMGRYSVSFEIRSGSWVLARFPRVPCVRFSISMNEGFSCSCLVSSFLFLPVMLYVVYGVVPAICYYQMCDLQINVCLLCALIETPCTCVTCLLEVCSN